MGLLSATGTTGEFFAWACARHANILSWYVSPLFLIPLAYFAYRRRFSGIVVTLLALATSMFWFPRPARVTPAVTEFLAFERTWPPTRERAATRCWWRPGRLRGAGVSP